MNTTVLIVICCILLLPCAIFAIKNYYKEVDPDGKYFWLSIFVAIPVLIILSPIFFFAFLKPLWYLWYYRNRPAPLPKKTRNILKTFVSDRRNVISLIEYNKRHNTNFTLEDVYGKKYVETLKEEVKIRVYDVKIDGLFNLQQGFLSWDSDLEVITPKIYNTLFITEIREDGERIVGEKKDGNVDELRNAYHNLCKTEDKAEYYNFLGIIYANATTNDTTVNTDPEHYFNIAAQKGSIDGAYNSAAWCQEPKKKFAWFLFGVKLVLREDNDKNMDNVSIIMLVNLAIMYHKGMGTEKNESEAEKWYKVAIERGATKALLNLGVLYIEQGRKSEAMELYAKAIRDDVTGWEGKQIKKIFMKLALNDKQFSQYYVNYEFNQILKDL